MKVITAEWKKRTDFTFIKKNLRSNRLMLLSSMALIILHWQIPWGVKMMSSEEIFALVFSMIIMIIITFISQAIVFSQISFIADEVKSASKKIRIMGIVSAFGMCCFEIRNKVSIFLSLKTKISDLASRFAAGFGSVVGVLLGIGFALLTVLSAFIIYSLTVCLLKRVCKRLKELWNSFSLTEKRVYAAIACVLAGFVCFSFFNGGAFWGVEPQTDVLFSSDTSNLVRNNAYMSLMHIENDLRQPLFAVFAAPFVGVGYALAFPFSFFSPVITPFFMNLVQILILIAANLMLARMLCTDSRGRICFMLLSSVTYTTILFSLMMEQYIFAYFWLMYVMYSYAVDRKISELSVCGAGGTLLTSLTLLPLAYDEKENQGWRIKPFVREMGRCVGLFAVLMLFFGRIEVVFNAFGRAKALTRFAGGNDMAVRLKQYLSFVASIFISPETVVVQSRYEDLRFYSLQLSDRMPRGFYLVGIIILALCAVSFFLHRKDRLAVIAGLWVCFSAALLFVVGWGSVENGMVLYSLYFGWAFAALLFRLIQWIADRLNLPMVTVMATGLLLAALCAANIRGVSDLWDFAFTYYPL